MSATEIVQQLLTLRGQGVSNLPAQPLRCGLAAGEVLPETTHRTHSR
jgi:hypothetical protein